MRSSHLDDHDRLRGIADALDVFLDQGAPPADPAFARLRWLLLRELSQHLARERCELARRGGRSPGLDERLDEVLRQHMTQWTGDVVQTRWPRYRITARSLLNRLRRRMDFEDRALLAMADLADACSPVRRSRRRGRSYLTRTRYRSWNDVLVANVPVSVTRIARTFGS